jgi:hypothetical protein
VFWDVRSSATIDTATSFQGNILALTSIALNTGATIGCGRALASTGAVTLQMNTIGGACDVGSVGGSSGGSGGTGGSGSGSGSGSGGNGGSGSGSGGSGGTGGSGSGSGSGGLSGGLTIPDTGGAPVFLPFAPIPGGQGEVPIPVPEPIAAVLLGSGLVAAAMRMGRGIRSRRP